MRINKLLSTFIVLIVGLVSCGSPDYEGTAMAINGADYNRYFVVKGVDENYLADKIQEYGSLSGEDDQNSYDFSFASAADWQIIKVDPSLDFYYYHNLIVWFLGVNGQEQYPEISIGVSIHKTDINQNFVGFVDPNNSWGDTEIGLFNDGTEFFIYLPTAYEPQGNLKVLSAKTSLPANLTEYFKTIGFDQQLLNDEALEFETEQILLQAIK